MSDLEDKDKVRFIDRSRGKFEISKEEFNKQLREKYNLTEREQAAIDELIRVESQMSDRLIDQYYINMAAFKECMPSIYEQFKDYVPKESFEFFCTESGVANLHFLDRNIVFYNSLNPKEICDIQVDDFLKTAVPRRIFYTDNDDVFGQIHYRYTSETYRLLEKYNVQQSNAPKLKDMKSSPFLMILGLGLGYVVESLYSKIEIANLVVIEPNPDLFFASLYAFDWASILDFIREHKLGLYLMVGQTKDQVINDLLLFLNNHGKFLACCSSALIHYIDDDMKTIADDLIKDFDKTYAAMGFFDDHLFGVSHGITLLMEKKRLACSKEKLPQDLEDVPVFIIGNGPSLDDDLAFIKRYQDKAVIVACGTAIDTLYNEGIKPDFYAATERTIGIGETLDIFNTTDFLDDIMLIAGDVIHPNTTRHFKRTAIFAKSDEPLAWLWIRDQEIYKKTQDWARVTLMNPLVGNLGVSSMIQFGFNKLFLFGIDNGKVVDPKVKSIHASNSSLYKEYGVPDTVPSYTLTTEVEGNFGGKVESNYIYKLSAAYIDKVVRILRDSNKDRNIKLYNCSNGAKLETCTSIHSKDIDLSFLPNIDKAYLRSVFDEKMTFTLDVEQDKLLKLINNTCYENLVNIILEKLKDMPKTRLEYVQVLQDCCETIGYLGSTKDRFYSFMIDGSVQNVFIHIQNAIFAFEDEEKSLKIANELLEKLIYLLEDSVELFKMIPNYIMDKHRELVHNKIGFDHEHSKAPDFPPKFITITNPDAIGSIPPFVKRYE